MLMHDFICAYCHKQFQKEEGSGPAKYCSSRCAREGYKINHQSEVTSRKYRGRFRKEY